MGYRERKKVEEDARKGEELFRQGRYYEAVAYLRRSMCGEHVVLPSYALLSYCHYKGYGTPVNHYAAYRWFKNLITKKGGIDIAKSILGSDFNEINSLRVSMPQNERFEFDDYLIGKVVARSGTYRERVQFYSGRVEVEISSQYASYDSDVVLHQIYDLYDWHERNRQLPPLLDENYREEYDSYSVSIERGNGDKYSHSVKGNYYTIIVPRDVRYDCMVTRESIVIESNKIMKKVAQKYLPQRLKELSEQTRLKYSECFIKKMNDCDGCYCKQSGQIYLIPEVIKYRMLEIDAILIHELCHSLVAGHEQDFYDLVLKYGGEEILRINKTFPEYKLTENT